MPQRVSITYLAWLQAHCPELLPACIILMLWDVRLDGILLIKALRCCGHCPVSLYWVSRYNC